MRSPEILRISWEVRELRARGERVFDLTLGDYDPGQFPPPAALVAGVARHLEAGRTNYPPADGIPELKAAIVSDSERRLGVRVPAASVLVASGARPLLYAAYASVLEPGDELVYAVPSWNNDYYGYLNGARPVIVEARPEARFLPTLADLEPHLESARVLHLNSPLNPAGAVMGREDLRAICRAVVAQNRRRSGQGRRPLVLIFDMVYWPLVYGGREFHHPLRLAPEVAPYLICIDAASKWMAATGLRVGWGLVPPFAQPRIKALVSHMGAWAPHAEQGAVADVLSRPGELDSFVAALGSGLEERLEILYRACRELAAEGRPIEALAPESGLYLTLKLDLTGARTPEGSRLADSEAVRLHLLQSAGVALIPFAAFGAAPGGDWYRASVGAIEPDRLRAAGMALASAVRALEV